MGGADGSSAGSGRGAGGRASDVLRTAALLARWSRALLALGLIVTGDPGDRHAVRPHRAGRSAER